MNKKRVLGKGIEALIPVNEDTASQVKILGIEELTPNPFQPRTSFKDEKIEELASSIKEKGVLQPLIVRKANEEYQIVAGERRWRAAQKAGIHEVPVIIKEFSDIECLEVALIENLQREDLNPVDEAKGYQRLLNDFKITQEELSKRVGKDRATIANSVRLLKLPQKVLEAVESKLISVGHARTLLSLENQSTIIETNNIIVQKKLSVRETEALINKIKKSKKSVKKKQEDKAITELEERLRKTVGTKVKIKGSGKKGKFEIYYYSADELERIKDILEG